MQNFQNIQNEAPVISGLLTKPLCDHKNMIVLSMLLLLLNIRSQNKNLDLLATLLSHKGQTSVIALTEKWLQPKLKVNHPLPKN